MAEFTSAEKVNIGYENEYSTDAMTGGPDKRRQLYYQLIQSMKKAESVDIIVSFLMESGVRMLLKELEHTLKRGAKIRILTGNYLGITQPSALYRSESSPDSCVKCYTMFLPFLLIKIDVFS